VPQIVGSNQARQPGQLYVFKRLLEQGQALCLWVHATSHAEEGLGNTALKFVALLSTISMRAFDAHGSELFTFRERFRASGSVPEAWTVSLPSEQQRHLDLQ
jgi:hypothetical protein